MRSSVACDECRRSKVKCFNDDSDDSTCRRCKGLGKKCVYDVKWKQRKSFIGRSRDRITTARAPKIVAKNQIDASVSRTPTHIESKPETGEIKCQIPERNDILEAIETFFATQYYGIFPFIHKPTFVNYFKSAEFDSNTYLDLSDDYTNTSRAPDPLVLVAMLALSARLCKPLVDKYGGFDEDNPTADFRPKLPTSSDTRRSPQAASKYFGWHARRMLQNEFDRPGLQKVQAFAMLSSHEWGERNAARGYMYISIASRMALVLGLGSSFNSPNTESQQSRNSNINLEIKRRTLWGCYMMDHCISSGRNRVPSIRVEEISIPMPCSEDKFLFGTNSTTVMNYHQALEAVNSGNLELTDQLSVEGCKIIFFELWAKIAKWVGEVGGRKEPAAPWNENSTYSIIMNQILRLEQHFPADLKYSKDNIEAHIANNTGGTFGYLHCLVFLCKIFLNREYLYLRPHSAPAGWWSELFKTLVHSTDNCAEMISSLISVNQMVVAPFTGFVAFTLVGINLYLGSFPWDLFKQENYSMPYINPKEVLRGPVKDEFTAQFKQERYEMTSKSIDILDTWNRVWSIAHNWMDLTNNLARSFPGISMESNEKFKDYGNWDIHDEDEFDTSKLTTAPAIAAATYNENEVVDLEFLNNVDMNLLIPGWNDVMSNDLFSFTNIS